jgi:hypothetical protein
MIMCIVYLIVRPSPGQNDIRVLNTKYNENIRHRITVQTDV